MGRQRLKAAATCLFVATYLMSSSDAAEFARVEHRWGDTIVRHQPERILSLSYIGIDTLLALELRPIAYRAWYGGDRRGLWPWAAARLPSQAAAVVLRGEIDVEAVARLRPDFVEAMYSGITRAQYSALSSVVPVLPAIAGKGDFGATWEDMLLGVGQATGRLQTAHAVIEEIEADFAAVRATHPEWEGMTAIVALPDGPLVFSDSDPRMAFMSRLGFRLPDAALKLYLGGFFFKLDRELTEPLEADVVLWLDVGSGIASVLDHPLRHTRRAVHEGREIVVGPELAAALSYASPLSIPFALERLVPMLESALNGVAEPRVPAAKGVGSLR